MRIGVCRKLDNAGSGEALEAILNRSYAALPAPSAFPTFLAFPALFYGVGDPNLFNRDSFRRCRKTSSLCCCSVVSIG